MAAVYIPPSPRPFQNRSMSNRPRAPLATVPNATNSPFRGLNAAAGKRSRPQGGSIQELSHGQPPQKRQMLEKEDVDGQTHTLNPGNATSNEGRVFTRRSLNPPTAFEQKLHLVAAESAREREKQQSRSAKIKATKGDQESMRVWRDHYRQAFPSYVFYFDSVPEDIRSRAAKQLAKFGAREEKFFSRAVTHVVTTRAIPPEYLDSTSAESTAPSSATTEAPPLEPQPQTINPSLLEKSSENISSQTNTGLLNVKFPFETSNARRQLPAEPDMRREASTKNDILLKARHFQMKIWALEKLNRMMQTLIDVEAAQHGHNTRSHSTTSIVAGKLPRENDLSQILRNERIHGPLDRDASVVTKDLVYFRGPYIYIHDIDEKTRPVMVREYPAVAHRKEGEWPMFRSAPQGKCPFVEDPQFARECEDDLRQEKAERKARLLAKQQQQNQEMARARSTNSVETRMEPPARRSVLREVIDQVNRNALPENRMPIPKCLQDGPPASLKHDFSAKGSENFPPPVFGRPRLYGGEPAASGVQPSNITSAIRSQMISSTAAAPGAKAGTSKEVHELKRKVLERSTSGHSVTAIPHSQRMTDIAGALRKSTQPTTREAKRRAQEKLGLGQINEEGNAHSDEDDSQKQKVVAKAPRKKAIEKRDPKPGYCENCRDKFDDFEEHIMSRKHRKFAGNNSNWTELDGLLSQLVRPWNTEISHVHAC